MRRKLSIVAAIVFLTILLGTPALFLRVQAQAQERNEWIFESCAFNTCIAETLKRIGPDRAATAKLTTWRDSTYVWYLK